MSVHLINIKSKRYSTYKYLPNLLCIRTLKLYRDGDNHKKKSHLFTELIAPQFIDIRIDGTDQMKVRWLNMNAHYITNKFDAELEKFRRMSCGNVCLINSYRS